MFEHRVTDNKAPSSDWFCKMCRSSLNTCPICTILNAFKHRKHSQDYPRFKNAKIQFSGLGRIYHVYFKGQYAQIVDCRALAHMGPCRWVVGYINNVSKDSRTAS